jgi:hypothetical protein
VPVKGPCDERIDSQPFQHRQVRLTNRAQVDWYHTVIMADSLPARWATRQCYWKSVDSVSACHALANGWSEHRYARC